MTHVALFLHLIGAMAFVAGAVVAGVGFEAARRRATAAEVAVLLSLTRTGVLLVLAGALVAGGCGLWLVQLEGWSFGDSWIWLSIVVFALALAFGAVGGQRPKQARKLAVAESAAGAAPSERLRALLDDPLSRWCNYGSALALLAIVYLMAAKP